MQGHFIDRQVKPRNMTQLLFTHSYHRRFLEVVELNTSLLRGVKLEDLELQFTTQRVHLRALPLTRQTQRARLKRVFSWLNDFMESTE